MNNDFIVPPPPAPAPFNPLATPVYHPNQGAPRIERAVDRAVSELGGLLVDLERAVGNLIDRVDPILTPDPVQAVGSQQPTPPRPAISVLAEDIERKSALVNQLIARIESVTNRLEL